ncbi:replication-relaxation family protein [Streptomyces anulatus]|uniref:replication-relaxation family protein n=1 Tax=Streptomyces anulatus TaxID=1892 RepID=UPI0033E2375C|nr:replication-relaxation family protein [Streptomyces anulatus]
MSTTLPKESAAVEETQPNAGETTSHRALALLAQHRLVTSPQLHQMLSPGKARSRTATVLNQLRDDKLIAYTHVPFSGRLRAWFLTSRGARITAGWPELRGHSVLTPDSATDASLRSGHTLTAVRTHLTFLRDAQERGDEYGPLDWVPEVSHRLPDTGGEDKLIADSVMHYTVSSPRRLQYRAFVEVDRATMSSERLARKLISYARFHDYVPQPVGRRGTVADQGAMLAWQRFYPRFPRVLFVLTNASPVSLENRIEDLRAMTSGHQLVSRLAGKVALGAAVLEDLEAHGASAPVWTPLSGPDERRSWTEL